MKYSQHYRPLQLYIKHNPARNLIIPLSRVLRKVNSKLNPSIAGSGSKREILDKYYMQVSTDLAQKTDSGPQRVNHQRLTFPGCYIGHIARQVNDATSLVLNLYRPPAYFINVFPITVSPSSSQHHNLARRPRLH